MAAPLAIPAIVGKAAQAVSQDLVVIDTKWYRKVKIKIPADNKRGWRWNEVLEPVDIQLHVNPVSVGLGAVAATFAIGLGWIAWNGVQGPFGPFIEGLKDSDYWQGVVGKLTQGKAGTASPAQQKRDALKICLDGCNFILDPLQRLACQQGCRAAHGR